MAAPKSWPRVQLVIGLIFICAAAWLFIVTKPKTSPTAISSAGCTQDIDQQVSTADVIAIGLVEMVVPGGTGGAQVIVLPTTFYKGSIDRPTLVINALDVPNSSGGTFSTTSEIHFQTGQPPFLLFLRRQSDGSFNTRACDGTRFLGSGLTSTELRALNPVPSNNGQI